MKAALVTLALSTSVLHAGQEDYYLREQIPTPANEVVEPGSIALMPEKKIAVADRRGDIWICSGAYEADLSKVTWKKFASGLHDPLGMFWKDGWLYLTQRPELTRIKDSDGDGTADTFETICDQWGMSGDYHEFTFGSTPDKNGNVWVVLCLTGSFGSEAPWRGWALRVTPKGEMIPTCSGIRSPGGIGFNTEGDAFFTDNQGPWNGSSSLKWLKPGSYQGHPAGNKWHGDKFPAPPEAADGSRILTERKKFPEFIPPAVILPHAKVGQSPTAIVTDVTGGKFGPWQKQMFIGEQTHSQVQRICLEKVNGLYQGTVFRFLEGFESGIVPMRQAEDGTLFVGGTSRGWASRGSKPFTFERVRWTGRPPFEIQEMSARPDGFELTFTDPVDPATAGDPASYAMDAWTYIYQSKYGSPEVDQTKPAITAATVSADKLKVYLKIDGLTQGNVHHLVAKSLKSAKGESLWHPEAWYTLNEIPK